MATDLADPPVDAPGASAPSRGGHLKIIVIVLTVVVLQGVATYFLLPSPAPVTEEEVDDEAEQAVVEVPIDKFSTTNTTAQNQRLHVTVEVVAIVASHQETAFDLAANDEHKARVRMVVNKVIRGANMEELGEPDSNTMRRRIREEINKLLRKSYVVEIVFSQYQTVEQ